VVGKKDLRGHDLIGEKLRKTETKLRKQVENKLLAKSLLGGGEKKLSLVLEIKSPGGGLKQGGNEKGGRHKGRRKKKPGMAEQGGRKGKNHAQRRSTEGQKGGEKGNCWEKQTAGGEKSKPRLKYLKDFRYLGE